MAFNDSAEELKYLQRSMSDLVSVLALPAVWSGQEPRKIVTTFHDALMATLNLDFLYTRARIESEGEPIEVLRTAPHYSAKQNEETIRHALNERFGDDPQKWPASVRSHPGGQEISLLSMQLGIDGEIGMVVAGSERAEFLTQSERLLLVVAANQVTVGLQQARLLSEQKRIAEELDRRVAERTRELAEANEVLQLQVGLLQHLPVSAWTLKPDGTPDFVNRVWLEFSGQSLDFVRSHPEAWMTAVHPEDRETASRAFWDGVRSGEGFAVETRSLRAKDGTYRWHLQQAVAVRDAEGKVLKFVGTTTDIDDQKRAQEALVASETNLRQILDSIPGLVCTLSPTGRIELANRQLLEYFGRTLEEINAWMMTDAIHPDDLPHVIEHHTRSMTTGTPYDFEFRARRADGIYRWFQARNLPMRDSDSRITGWSALMTDIEDRKRAEDALQASEISLRQTLDTIPGLVSKANSNGMIELANRQLLTYFGKTTEEMNSWSTSDVVHPDDLPRATAEITHSFETGTPFDSELRYRRADGVHRWFQARSLPFRGADGEVAGWYFLLTDIEDRKRAEEALRASEYEARLIADSIPGMVGQTTPTGNLEMVSQQALEFFGKTIEELSEWGTNDTIHPEDLPGVIDAFSRAIATGRPYEFSARFRRADGVYRWLQDRGSPLRDQNGDIVRWYLLITDIDDQKRAEEALRESEHESRLIVDSIPGLIAVLSASGEVERLNQPMLDYLGKSLEESRQWAVDDTVHPDDRPGYIQAFAQAFATGDPVEYEAVRVRRFDGVYRWLNMRGLPLRDRHGNIVRWYFLLTEIDDRKRAEDALRESEYESRLIVDGIPGLIAVLDKNGELERVNQPILDYLGKSLEECRQWAVDDTIHPDDRPGYLQAFGRSFAAGEPVEYDAARIRRFDGVYRWLNMRGLPLRDRQGHIVRWYFLLTEVDDRKRAEDELRRSEARHRVVVETASDAVISIDESGAIILANPATKRIFEYAPEELIGKSLTILMPGGMRGLHETGFKRYLETGAKHLNWQGTEMTALRANGEEFPVEVSFGEMVTDERKVFTGFIRDISGKKRAEEELRNTHAELARVMRVMTIGQLTASIAHEVNQPLSGIVMNASTCLRMLSGEQPNIEGARETARRTIRDGNRASEIVTRLRTLFKRKEVTAESIDLNDAAREVIVLSLSELQSHGITVRHDFAENLPAVKGDRVQLQQVILNLTRNALDAMRDVDDRPRELLIKTESGDSKSVQLTVQDTGIGFAPDAANRLFDSFYTTKDDGMGVGLSVCRSIIEAHRGRIWASANKGPGSSFAFSIPRDTSDEPA
jgi:PAS domain S-box-containing protein